MRFTQSLARAFIAAGGEIRCERAQSFTFVEDRVDGVVTAGGRSPASAVVVAAGAWSKPLAAQLGARVPLDTERGYHAMIKDPEVRPRLPVMDADAKFVATPMEHGLRMAGTVEFAGLAAAPDWRRARVLLTQGREMFPALARDAGEERVALWMGFRPSLPDSLPVIGPTRTYANAFFAFGHGHVGLAAAPMTGRLVADLVTGRKLAIDVAPFSVRRFG